MMHLNQIPYADATGALSTYTGVVSHDQPHALTPFHYRKVGKRLWELTADLLLFDGKNVVRIRRGFRWNGASVPWLARWYCAVDDYLMGSCYHDWLYGYHRVEVWNAFTSAWEWQATTKAYADRAFEELIEDVYFERWSKAEVLWLSVRVGGWWSWSTGTCKWDCAAGKKCPSAKWCPIRHLSAKPPAITTTLLS